MTNIENFYLNKLNQEKQKKFNYLYRKAKNLILSQPSYSFNKVFELLEKKLDNNLNKNETALFILEKFHHDEGALPGKLELVYLNLIFAPELIINRLNQGGDFYEIIREINEDIRRKKIYLNKDLISNKVNELKKLLIK